MATVTVPRRVKGNLEAVTAVITFAAYAIVTGTFQGWLPIYPTITEAGVNLIGHAIAVINTTALACLLLGWYWIRRGQVAKHRAAMITAFTLILVFLLLYLPKVGGGGEKHLAATAPDIAAMVYLVMLAIHIVLSVLAMPIVLYAFLLGLTHTPRELARTPHARIGRVAATAWIISLSLGIITYLALNHVYGYEFIPA